MDFTLKSQDGFTLTELLITTAIIAILSTIAIPSFSYLIESVRSISQYNSLMSAIQYSRSKAAFSSNIVIMCATIDEENCHRDWRNPVMIFIDKNDNKKRDKDEYIDRVFQFTEGTENLIWKASGRSRYLRYVYDGSTVYLNGSFTWCSSRSNSELTKKIIIYRTGRARKAKPHEINHDLCN